MKVSFLVTYYNQKQYVKQSLDSILRIEKPCDWEILVGDDGSDDGTIELVRQYMAQYPAHIFLYIMDREKGKKYEVVRRASANRLNLISHMTGDFFCTLDGDDCYCSTDFLTRALDIFEKEPGVSVAAFGYHTFSEEAGILTEHTLPAGIVPTETYLAKGMFTHAGACVHKNCMTPERMAYLADIGYFDDNNIVINSLHFGAMYAVDEIVYAYRQTENSIYNRMQYAEKAVLNAQSYDVDALLLPEQEPAIALRYGICLLQTYLLGKKLKKLLGAQKWQQYLTSCRQLNGALTDSLLDPTLRTPQTRKRIRRILLRYAKAHPKATLGSLLRCGKYRIFG